MVNRVIRQQEEKERNRITPFLTILVIVSIVLWVVFFKQLYTVKDMAPSSEMKVEFPIATYTNLKSGETLSEDVSPFLYRDVQSKCRGVESHLCYKGYVEGEVFNLEVDMNNRVTAVKYGGTLEKYRKDETYDIKKTVLSEGMSLEELKSKVKLFLVETVDKKGISYEIYYSNKNKEDYFLRFEKDQLVSVSKTIKY